MRLKPRCRRGGTGYSGPIVSQRGNSSETVFQQFIVTGEERKIEGEEGKVRNRKEEKVEVETVKFI